jgi:Ca-activated chloride channel family protein
MRFAAPHLLWLLLVLPPALMFFLWRAERTRRRLLATFIQARLLPELTVGVSPGRQQLAAWLLTVAVALLIVALARPQWGFTWEESKQKGLDVVIAIDTSKSMLAEDIAPNRLARAKLAALELMQLAQTDRLGLVAFAGGAFLQCPMTFDDAAFRQSVDLLDVNTLPQGGTAVAEAITTATAAFKEDDNFKVLILFSDGEDQDSGAIEAARKAAEKGLRIFTIGVGSADGELLRIRDSKGRTDYVKDDAGNVVKSRLNEQLLQDIATAGQGFYLPLKGAKVIETLYEKGLAPLPKSESDAKLYKRYHEQFHWPLGLAFLLLLIEFILPERRAGNFGKPTAKVAALLGLLFLSAGGTEASPSAALKEFQAGRFEQARTEYERLLAENAEDLRLAFNAAAAAHRAGDFAQATKHLDRVVNAPDLALQQRAYYNRGNAQFHLGEAAPELPARREAWERSLKDFDSARKLDAKDADAQANYEFVKKKLEEMKQQEQPQQQQQKQDQSQDQSKDQPKQDQPQQPKDQSGDQSKPEEQSSKDQKQPEQPKSEKDSQPDQQKPEPKDTDQQQPQPKPSDAKPKEGNPQSGEPKPGEANAQPQPAGQMTPEQAQRVLNMQKGDEQVLPVQLLAPQQQKERPLKDW